VLLAGLTTGHAIGLGVVALVFVTFALLSSFVGPRWRADFPGPRGIKFFIVISFVLFAAMLGAVAVFGAEKTEKVSEAQAAVAAGKPVAVTENEFHVILAPKTLPAGSYTFVVKNAGKIQHDLAVVGSGVNVKTPLINPGATASVTAKLVPGSYVLFCTVPGHRAAGMVAKLTVH
jgi:uncharacterized cupredoxin-like copper-binding protein